MNLYKYHRQEQTQLSVHDGINNDYNLPERKFNIYWKYANPDGKDNKIANTILHIQGNKIANNLDKASNEEIAGYTENNPYEITDEIYNKVIANQALETHITNKYKNKLIILDNASSHRNERIKELVNKHNKILYAVPYQHFTNSIENYFSMLKSRLYKVSEEGEGLTHEKLKANITSVIRGIPKEKYENIFKGAYNRDAVYVKNKTRKRKLKNYKV